MSPALDRTLERDEHTIAVTTGVSSLRHALRGLAEQPQLDVPVRYLLDPRGRPALRAEVPRVLPVAACVALANDALDAVAADGGRARPLAAPPELPGVVAPDDAALRERIEALGFPFEAAEGGFTLEIVTGRAPARVELGRSGADGRLHAVAARSLRLDDPSSLHAMARYALELNHRLRVARASVDGTAYDVARVVWDVVLPPAVASEAGLRQGLEALAVARAVSNDVFTAMRRPSVAGAYLAQRFPEEDASWARAAPRAPTPPQAIAASP